MFGIGAHYKGTGDVSTQFIKQNLAGCGWNASEAPDLHQFFKSLSVGDIVYLKSYIPKKTGEIIFSILAIGFIRDDAILDAKSTERLVEVGRNVDWKVKGEFRIPAPEGKNNVRANTIYQEFHPEVQAEIIKRL